MLPTSLGRSYPGALASLSMKLLNLDHVAVAVRHLDDSLAAYRQLFGVEPLYREVVEDQGVEEAMIPVGGSFIQLLEPLGRDTPVGRFLERRGEGLHHVAFAVPDVSAALSPSRGGGRRVGRSPAAAAVVAASRSLSSTRRRPTERSSSWWSFPMAERVSITPAPDAFAAAVIGAVIAHLEAEAAGLVPSPSPQLPAWVASARPGRPIPRSIVARFVIRRPARDDGASTSPARVSAWPPGTRRKRRRHNPPKSNANGRRPPTGLLTRREQSDDPQTGRTGQHPTDQGPRQRLRTGRRWLLSSGDEPPDSEHDGVDDDRPGAGGGDPLQTESVAERASRRGWRRRSTVVPIEHRGPHPPLGVEGSGQNLLGAPCGDAQCENRCHCRCHQRVLGTEGTALISEAHRGQCQPEHGGGGEHGGGDGGAYRRSDLDLNSSSLPSAASLARKG